MLEYSLECIVPRNIERPIDDKRPTGVFKYILNEGMRAFDRHPVHVNVIAQSIRIRPKDLSKIHQNLAFKCGSGKSRIVSQALHQSLMYFLNSSRIHSRVLQCQPVFEDGE